MLVVWLEWLSLKHDNGKLKHLEIGEDLSEEGEHMFSSLSINPCPIYNSMEDSKAGFSNGAQGSPQWYWSLFCLMNEWFCIIWLMFQMCVCVCVFLSFSCSLSLTTIFPPSFVPCLNLLNSVRFDVCCLLWLFMPLMSWMKIYRLEHESVGEGDKWHVVIERCEDLIMYVFSLCFLNAYWHHG